MSGLKQPRYRVEDYTLDDWALYFQELIQVRFGVPVPTPKAILRKSFERLLQDIGNAYLLHMALETLILDDEGYVSRVGPNERLLTIGTINTVVHKMGGYDQPWQAMYYKRFAQTQDEADYFTKWLGFWSDARSAPVGTEARIGDNLFPSWKYVEQLSERRLERAVGTIQGRFSEEGTQIAHDWKTRLVEPLEPSALVKQIREEYEKGV